MIQFIPAHTINEVKEGLKEKIIEAIQRCYKEDGKISKRSFEKKDYAMAVSTIRRNFGTWEEALLASGIEPNQKPKNSSIEVAELKKDIIAAMQRCYEEEGNILRETFLKKPYRFSANMINRAFGTYSNAVYQAGLGNNKEKYDKEKILCVIKQFIDEQEGRTDFASFQVNGYGISYPTIQRYFGSWEKAFEMAKFGGEMPELYTKKDLINQFHLPENFVRGLQHIPALDEKLIKIGTDKKTGIIVKIPEENIDYIMSYYQSLKAEYEKYKSQKGWFSSSQCKTSIYFTDEMVDKMISNGTLVDKTDYVILDRINWKHMNVQEHFLDESKILFVHRNSFSKFNLATLGTMLKKFRKLGMKTSLQTLELLQKSGLIKPETQLEFENAVFEYFDFDHVLHVLTQYMSNNDAIQSRISSYDYLNEFQQKYIDDYIETRDQGIVIKWNNYSPKRYVAHKDLRLPEMRNRISNAFFSIICGRCGISYSSGVADLTDKELEKFNPDVFEVIDVSIDDYRYIAKGRKTSTLVQRYSDLKPFYYWILMNKDMEDKKTFEDYQSFDTLRKRIENFLNQFPKKLSDAPANEKIDRITKVYLTREDLIRCRDAILQDFRSRNSLKDAALWVLCSLTGVRPEELLFLRIEHFLLDEDGLLKLNDKNYGEINIDATVGKGERSISHLEYNTPIPPEGVEQVNLYLKDLYKRQGPSNPRGKGYFLRKHDVAIESQLKAFEKKFINRLRSNADFLPKEKRNHLILKNTRHTMNNIISHTFIRDERLAREAQKLVAHYQMRHKPQNQSMGDMFYSEDISRDDYYAILDLTINFPWDLEQLKEWESKHGYNEHEDSSETVSNEVAEDVAEPTTVRNNTMDSSMDDTEKAELLKELELVQEQLIKTKVRDKNTPVTKWMKARKDLLNKEKQLKIKLSI